AGGSGHARDRRSGSIEAARRAKPQLWLRRQTVYSSETNRRDERCVPADRGRNRLGARRARRACVAPRGRGIRAQRRVGRPARNRASEANRRTGVGGIAHRVIAAPRSQLALARDVPSFATDSTSWLAENGFSSSRAPVALSSSIMPTS